MAGLKSTGIFREIIWLGRVPASGASIRSEPLELLELGFDGVDGEQHQGVHRPSCPRVSNLYPKGTQIANTRQLSLLSAEEMDGIAAEMGLSELDPTHLGTTIVMRGIPDFSHLPPSSRLRGESGAVLTVDLENGPCIFPGREIEAEKPGFGKRFKPAAMGRRGITAWVERPGSLVLGEQLELFVPDQRAWAP